MSDELLDTLPTDVTPDTDDAPPFDVAAIRADVERLDPGPLARDERERQLCRYVRRRAQLIEERERVREAMTAMIRRLDGDLAGLDYAYAATVEAAARELLAGGKRKSLDTPWGVVGFRSEPAKLVVTDEAAVRAAVKSGELPESVIVVKEEVSKSRLNELFRAGEIPPGCEVQESREKFYVK